VPRRPPSRAPSRIGERWGASMPRPFNKLTAIAAPIMRSNIDTDVIIRIERLVGNSVRGTLGKWAFGSLRYLADGSENPEFMLNREPYRRAEILVTGPNFGCGSSREGAVWSLQEMGIRAIIGSGFGDIFFANCFQNGILPVVVDKAIVDDLAAEIEATQGAGRVSVDLEAQTITSPSGQRHSFEIDPRRREGLLQGLDEVAQTLQRDNEILAFQAADRIARPWIYLAEAST
jgi:3-isopropylmalate/(R)-2-methylmalate dehydratase small subunit